MKKTYLKPRKLCMILFTICDLFIMNVYDGDGRKKTEIYTRRKQRKKSPVWLPFHPPVYEKMEADCFPVSENTENKPDLPYVGRGP